MCVHYAKSPQLTFDFIQFTKRDKLRRLDPNLHPEFSAPADFPEDTYPKSMAPLIIEEGGTQRLVMMHWGVLTQFAGTGKPFVKPVHNARTDKFSSFTWRSSVAERRCLIPATGFYEAGPGPEGARGKVFFTLPDRPVFFFAGIWDRHRIGEGRGFAMVTTEPNVITRPFHDRMPVILTDDEAMEWIGDQPLPPDQVAELCRSQSSDALQTKVFAAKPKDERPPKLTVKRPSKEPPPEQPTLF